MSVCAVAVKKYLKTVPFRNRLFFFVAAHTIFVKKSFARSALILAVIGIVAKLIGVFYRVPLTNIVGAEGMGLYQMVFPVYTVLLSFCGGGITSAVSRVVAKYTAKGDDAAALKAVRVALVPLVAVSAISALAVVLLRRVISGVQGNVDAALCYIAVSPSLLFAGGIGVLRGYFQGRSLMLPSGVSQLAEQTVKLALGISLARTLLKYGVKYAVAGALIGVSASELVALFYLAIRFFVYRKKQKKRIEETEKTVSSVAFSTLLKELFSFALPVTLGGLIIPFTQMIDSALVINILAGGETRQGATALFGLFVGPVGTLLNLPSVVVTSVAAAFLPALTSAVERGDVKSCDKIKRDAAKWIMLVVIPAATVYAFFPKDVLTVLYGGGLSATQIETAASLLRIQSVSVFYMGALQFSATVMQSYGKSHKPTINLGIGAAVKIALTPILVYAVGIFGAAAASAAFIAVAAVLDCRSADRKFGIGADVRVAFIFPVLCSAGAAFVYFAATVGIGGSPLLRLAVGGAAFSIVYLLSVLPLVFDIKTFIAQRRKKQSVEPTKKT